MIEYRETKEKTKSLKEQYVRGFEKLIAEKEQQLAQERKDYCKNIFKNSEKYRRDLKQMLGWPLCESMDQKSIVADLTKLDVAETFTLYRVQLEVLEGLRLSGLYFEKKGALKKPLVLVQHGGLGTPELISGIYDGDTANYNDMLARVLQYDVHVFAPQLLLWDEKRYEVACARRELDARLKRVGSSVAAVELYGLMRALDYFEAKENVASLGMVGLSYGGFYTLYLAALDTRIKSAVSCSFFNTRDQYPWSDLTWFSSAKKFDDAEVAAMVYPRKLCIALGSKDELFSAAHGIRSYEALVELCREVGTDWLSFLTFDGGHEFCKDDAPIKALVHELADV